LLEPGILPISAIFPFLGCEIVCEFIILNDSMHPGCRFQLLAGIITAACFSPETEFYGDCGPTARCHRFFYFPGNQQLRRPG
jgi:hypothetical protein